MADIFTAYVSDLKGFTEAIESVFPETIAQFYIVHQIRTSLTCISYKDRKAVAADLKPVYTAVTENEALYSLEIFAGKMRLGIPDHRQIAESELAENKPDVPVSAGNQARYLYAQRHRILELQPA